MWFHAPQRPEKGTIRIQHSEREASMASEGSWQSPRKCAFCGAHPIYQDPHLNFVWDTCHAVRLGHIEHIIWFCMYYIYISVSSCGKDFKLRFRQSECIRVAGRWLAGFR